MLLCSGLLHQLTALLAILYTQQMSRKGRVILTQGTGPHCGEGTMIKMFQSVVAGISRESGSREPSLGAGPYYNPQKNAQGPFFASWVTQCPHTVPPSWI